MRDQPSQKPLLDKLGVKPGARVAVVGVDDETFLAQLQAQTADVSLRARKGCDLLFFRADRPPDLRRLHRLRDAIKADGAIWVVRPKGTGQLTENDIIPASREAGLVDVKVVSFSDTHSALKLVVPVSQR